MRHPVGGLAVNQLYVGSRPTLPANYRESRIFLSGYIFTHRTQKYDQLWSMRNPISAVMTAAHIMEVWSSGLWRCIANAESVKTDHWFKSSNFRKIDNGKRR